MPLFHVIAISQHWLNLSSRLPPFRFTEICFSTTTATDDDYNDDDDDEEDSNDDDDDVDDDNAFESSICMYVFECLTLSSNTDSK